MASMDLLPPNDTSRKVIHLDMDAFYASVEERDNPVLKTKALVIAHDPRKHRGHGVITTANYRARKYGVGSAMPAQKALDNIPAKELVFVTPDFVKYRAVSATIHAIMHEVTDIVESVALDEAYLDVTQNKLGKLTTIELAQFLQQEIYRQTHLTCSVGISYNKFLAKLASEYAKPFGRAIILPDVAQAFLATKDVGDFPGIGKKTAVLMHEIGINTGYDLQQKDVRWLISKFKKAGYYYAQHAHGIDLREVIGQRKRKSVGKERTFEPVIVDRERALPYLQDFTGSIAQILREKHLRSQTIVLKIRSKDFETVTKRTTIKEVTQDEDVIYRAAVSLLDEFPEFLELGIRLLGISTTNFIDDQVEELTLPLFETQ